MKKIFIALILGCAGISAHAQFTEYHNIYEMEEANTAPVQTMNGYVPTTNGWIRLTIRVKETSNSVIVVGYKQKDTSTFGGAFSTYGSSNPWRSCQAWAQNVSVYSDGREIANEFNYKASISGLGIVYF